MSSREIELIKELFDEQKKHQQELSQKYRVPVPQRDWKGWVATVLAVLAAVAAFTTSYFKTNSAALAEHTELKAQTSQIAESLNVYKAATDAKQASIKEDVSELKVITKDMYQNQLLIGEKLRVRDLRRDRGE